MKYNPAIHHRHSIRLKGYDYSSAGAYFVTFVLQHRLRLFGTINENGMQLTAAGTIARQCWEEIPKHFPHAALDEFVIMPDHMHGIIVILEDENKIEGICGGVQLNATTKEATTSRKNNYFSIISPKKKTLSIIIRTYKAAVTTICREKGLNDFKWQRNYYERIIRDERAFAAIRKYILNNPAKWLHDREKESAM